MYTPINGGVSERNGPEGAVVSPTFNHAPTSQGRVFFDSPLAPLGLDSLMRWRYSVGVPVGAAFVLGWLILQHRNQEPSYGGKSLSAWLIDLDLEKSGTTDRALRAVQAIGTDAFPTLTRMIRFQDPLWRQGLMALNARQSLFQLPVTPASVIRNRALQGYTALGARAQGNVPTLIGLLQTESSASIRSSVAAALGSIGPAAAAAIPALVKAADDPDPNVRRECLWALANIQRWSPEAYRFRSWP